MLAFTQSTLALYCSRKLLTAAGCSFTKSARATTTPVSRAEPLSRASHSSVRSRATRRSGSWVWATVTKGWGSMAMVAAPDARDATHSLCSLFQSMVTPVSGAMPFSVSRYRRTYSGVEPLPEATMVRPARSAMDWTELPFSTIYSTPRVFTARVTMPPSVRLYSTEARLAGTQAMSSSPCISLGDTSSAEAARVNS